MPPKLNESKLSIIIPTKNAGPEFKTLLSRLTKQKRFKSVEIILVDSGSSDTTLSLAQKFACKIVRISPFKFNHAFARNRGAEEASGDFLLFTVQDALPPSDDWLFKMFAALKENAPRGVVAVSCIESPRPDSDLYYNFCIYHHYRSLNCLSRNRFMRFKGEDFASLKKNGALSNLACLIRKDVFERYKFRSVFGEDMDLGIRLIRHGHKLLMLSKVKIIHSHNRSPFYFLKRGFANAVHTTETFSDFPYVPIRRPDELFSAICLSFQHVNRARLAFLQKSAENESLQQNYKYLVAEFAHELIAARLHKEPASAERLPDKELECFIADLNMKKKGHRSSNRILATLLDQLVLLGKFLKNMPWRVRGTPRQQLSDFLMKMCAHEAGWRLGLLYQTCSHREMHRDLMETLRSQLTRGI